KQLGERRGNGLEQCLLSDEMHIGLYRKARGWQKTLKRSDVIPVEPKAVGELEPTRDASFAGRSAVVIDETTAPLPPDVRIRTARNQARVLYRNHGLIVVTVECPGLNLALGAFAAMKHVMERVQPVVAPRPYIAQLRFQFLGRQQHR